MNLLEQITLKLTRTHSSHEGPTEFRNSAVIIIQNPVLPFVSFLILRAVF